MTGAGLHSETDQGKASDVSIGLNLPAAKGETPTASRKYKSLRLFAWGSGITLAILLLPQFVERMQYAATRGRERAEADVARSELRQVSLDDLSRVFRLVAKSVGPSVVHIEVKQPAASARTDLSELNPHLDYEFPGIGSGVILDESGHIVTNLHVVEGAETILVRLSDGRVQTATVIGTDRATDLAVIRIESGRLVPAPWGESNRLKAGDFVWAVGSPFGLDHSITFGIVSGKGRRGMIGHRYHSFLQTDAEVNPGNSGGPLVNAQGEVVGINTAIVGTSFRGISFAIPSEIARAICDQLIRSGSAAPLGWFGVIMSDLTPELRENLYQDVEEGVHISRVVASTPADRAGIQADDLIVSWGGRPIASMADLAVAVAATPAGTSAEVTFLRDARLLHSIVTVGEKPAYPRL